jgi:hypothetical protein
VAERPDLSLIDEIDKLARRDPFVPFTIVTSSGQQYAIDASDVVAVGLGVIFVVRHRQGYHVLRQGHITEVSVFGEPS